MFYVYEKNRPLTEFEEVNNIRFKKISICCSI